MKAAAESFSHRLVDMVNPDWIEHRRGDGELLGWMSPGGEGFVPVDLFGRPLADPVDWLAAEGYDPMFGARPVKRTLQRYLVNELSKEILAGQVDRNSTITVDADAKGLVFKN